MISLKQKYRIYRLLAEGLTVRDIATREKVALSTVYILKRNPSRRQELQEARQCPGCKAMLWIWPCLLCHPDIDLDSQEPKEIKPIEILEAGAAETLEMLRIVQDIRGLFRLNLIKNPLFLALARRAEESLNRITPPNKEK